MLPRLEDDESRVLRAVFSSVTPSSSPARRALEILTEQQRGILRNAVAAGADPDATGRLLASCFRTVERGVELQEARCEP